MTTEKLKRFDPSEPKWEIAAEPHVITSMQAGSACATEQIVFSRSSTEYLPIHVMDDNAHKVKMEQPRNTEVLKEWYWFQTILIHENDEIWYVMEGWIW